MSRKLFLLLNDAATSLFLGEGKVKVVKVAQAHNNDVAMSRLFSFVMAIFSSGVNSSTVRTLVTLWRRSHNSKFYGLD